MRPELGFHAVTSIDHEFIGFCSFGLDGQVPGGDYALDALDIGLGMKPSLTGAGLGRHFFHAILDYAHGTFAPVRYRLTVATFNARALRLYLQFGFVPTREFLDAHSDVHHTIMIRPPLP